MAQWLKMRNKLAACGGCETRLAARRQLWPLARLHQRIGSVAAAENTAGWRPRSYIVKTNAMKRKVSN